MFRGITSARAVRKVRRKRGYDTWARMLTFRRPSRNKNDSSLSTSTSLSSCSTLYVSARKIRDGEAEKYGDENGESNGQYGIPTPKALPAFSAEEAEQVAKSFSTLTLRLESCATMPNSGTLLPMLTV